jgi:hypothetical protein
MVVNKKAGLPLTGNPAVLSRPVAFRPCLSTGLAFSGLSHQYHKHCRNANNFQSNRVSKGKSFQGDKL